MTGTYKIVDWQRYQSRLPHLSVCKFPDPAADPMVDLLIGQDQIDLHFSKCDVKGDPGEPVARLGPLGWSCIGHPDRRTTAKEIQTNLAYTLFCRPRVFDEINDSLKRLREIESLISTNLNEWYSVTLQPLFKHSTCPRKMQEFTRKSFLMHPLQSANVPIWITH